MLLGAHYRGFPFGNLPQDFKALQIFIYSPTSQVKRKQIWSQQSAHDVSSLVDQYDLELFVHSTYAVNPANQRRTHLESILAQLDTCELLHAKGLVIHSGKSVRSNPGEARKRMVEVLSEATSYLASQSYQTKLILETPAGQGTELGAKIEDLVAITAEVPDWSEHGAFCLDTAHLWGAGYDISPSLYDLFPPDQVALVHFNGSKEEQGSHIDRHADIGGKSNRIPLNDLLKFYRPDIPHIMETKQDELSIDQQRQIILA